MPSSRGSSQGSNPCLQHWQVGSLWPVPSGKSPVLHIVNIQSILWLTIHPTYPLLVVIIQPQYEDQSNLHFWWRYHIISHESWATSPEGWVPCCPPWPASGITYPTKTRHTNGSLCVLPPKVCHSLFTFEEFLYWSFTLPCHNYLALHGWEWALNRNS